MINRISKVAGILIFACVGASVPGWIGVRTSNWWPFLGALGGALFCALVVLPLLNLCQKGSQSVFGRVSVSGLCLSGLGLLFGLSVSALGMQVLRQISGHVIPALEIGGSTAITLVSILLFHAKRDDFQRLLNGKSLNPERIINRSSAKTYPKVLDTSAIIDGRIADICKTGFLEGTFLVPGFVLAELQRIADSSDALKRNRGRRGLDILNHMQKDGTVAIKICDKDFDDLSEVDTKIVRLARLIDGKVVTNDFNLNKVAELYGVPVLNINELSNAIKPIVLPGEEMLVHVVKDGKEFGQGIAYLEDGTMVVVDGGKEHIGTKLDVLVTSVLQTAAGRMIFCKPKEHLRREMAQNQ